MKYVIVSWAFLFGVANPAMFYKFMQRYVLELYHDKKEDKYTAFIPSPFIAGRSKVVFSPEECKMPPKITAFTSFLVKGRPIFVNSDAMSYSAYMRMLRYASEFDYENPERQQQYKDAVQQSIERITKPNHEETDKDKKP
uniref:transmembrane protein 70 homolog, mitochondrial-like isoform X1 n=2 Tax=Styela clava TaxID=7725 RepID=UPI00193AB089|nr:transmembrane protein 70 homolog, mitochondrial-like isoform X1 [Styela clava]